MDVEQYWAGNSKRPAPPFAATHTPRCGIIHQGKWSQMRSNMRLILSDLSGSLEATTALVCAQNVTRWDTFTSESVETPNCRAFKFSISTALPRRSCSARIE